MKIKIFGLILFVSLLCIGMISAAKPGTGSVIVTSGITISYPSPYYVKQNEDFFVRFWVYNNSQTTIITNTSANCTYNLLDMNGKNLIRLLANQSPTTEIKFGGLGGQGCANCFNFNLSSVFFNHSGYYSYQIRCQGLGIGGYLTDNYEVTPSGTPFDISQSIIIFSGLVLLLIISIILFVFGMNNRIIGIKIFSIGLSVLMMFYALAYTLMSVNNTTYQYPGLSSIFNNLYYLASVILVCGGIGLVLFLIKFALDAFYKSRGMRD